MKKQIFSNSVASEPFVSYNSSKPLEEFDCAQKLMDSPIPKAVNYLRGDNDEED